MPASPQLTPFYDHIHHNISQSIHLKTCTMNMYLMMHTSCTYLLTYIITHLTHKSSACPVSTMCKTYRSSYMKRMFAHYKSKLSLQVQSIVISPSYHCTSKLSLQVHAIITSPSRESDISRFTNSDFVQAKRTLSKQVSISPRRFVHFARICLSHTSPVCTCFFAHACFAYQTKMCIWLQRNTHFQKA